jgi:hypothetical protein
MYLNVYGYYLLIVPYISKKMVQRLYLRLHEVLGECTVYVFECVWYQLTHHSVHLQENSL